MTYTNTKHQIDPAASSLLTIEPSRQPHSHLRIASLEKSPKSLLNKTMVFVFVVFQWGEGDAEGADISLLCKCSFPHKQRGVQNSRVERGESMAHVCVCVCSFRQARDRWGEALCVSRLCAALLVLTALQLAIPTSLGIHFSRDKPGLDGSRLTPSMLHKV